MNVVRRTCGYLGENYWNKGRTEEIKNRYAPQLKYYKLALEKALNKKVAKTCLFLLDTGEVIEVV